MGGIGVFIGRDKGKRGVEEILQDFFYGGGHGSFMVGGRVWFILDLVTDH